MQSSPDWKVGFLKILKLRSGWKSRWMFEKPRQFAHVQRGDGEGRKGGDPKIRRGRELRRVGRELARQTLLRLLYTKGNQTSHQDHHHNHDADDRSDVREQLVADH